jgi:hypothetical protein
LPKTRKYEAKRLRASFSAPLSVSPRVRSINRSIAEFSVLFILASGRFSEMFTTYSHALCGCSPAGLRLEISLETDKKKMNFIFSRVMKFFLTRT